MPQRGGGCDSSAGKQMYLELYVCQWPRDKEVAYLMTFSWLSFFSLDCKYLPKSSKLEGTQKRA